MHTKIQKLTRMYAPALALTMLATLFPAHQSHARLGESSDEVDKRLGASSKVPMTESIADLALREFAGAWRIEPGPDHEVAELFRVLDTWSWKRVSFQTYKTSDFIVMVIFLDGKSVFEQYSHGPTFTKEEMDALLTANSGGNKWQRSNNPANTNGAIQTWRVVDTSTKKPSRFAVTNGGSNLSFYTPALLLYCADAAKSIVNASDKKRSDGVKGF